MRGQKEGTLLYSWDISKGVVCLMREKMVRELQNLNYGIFRSDRKSEEDTYLVFFFSILGEGNTKKCKGLWGLLNGSAVCS